MKFYDFFKLINNGFYKVFVQPIIKSSFGYCGKKVIICRSSDFFGIHNVYIGNNVSINVNNLFLSTNAKIIIHDNVMTGPNVTFITGNHNFMTIGEYMVNHIKNSEDNNLDKDIVVEGDNWIGANSIILKGVVIGRGAVIGAGSVVTKSIPPYSVVAGNPAKVIKMRFTQEQINEHERLLNENTNR